MNASAWALLVPVGITLVAAVATVLVVIVAMKDTASGDRATVLKAVAEVIRAVRGSRRT
ncbi:hypothetical protein GCM10023347_14290 [Streptomyces chumphonensis]|uniref:Uncharacterized protein n=1 Tax=Streptomyces chumphonensis TaxID=1214925 RepID=A0A927ICX4_9ACTN|nr:hypothetical protein [Streptomyces chumphonensis]MBD3932325.1 hypothetical protein [Streptomyces chumphonensis]